jgi:S1-C subfamily serine protease
MIRFLAALIACALAMPAAAQPSWPVEDMNRAIDSTNFVVGRGCSGTLISLAPQLILTNYHCIDDAITNVEREVTDGDGFVKKVRQRKLADVTVEQNSYEGFARVGTASFVAEIVADDVKRDLAVLKVKGALPNRFASPLLPDGAKVQRGERVYAVGNPAGNENTVVEGIVSNVNRTFEFAWTDGAKLPMIQFSGGIYGGNSGGALYNAKGELVGVPAAGHQGATFIGLAIPIEVAKALMRERCLAAAFDLTADDEACRKAKVAKKPPLTEAPRQE